MNLHFKRYGQGAQTIVIIHGLFGSLDNWQTFAKSIADHYSVITVDLRNHGHSPHTDQMNYSLLAEDIHTFLESHSLNSVFLMGHSMGGKVSMQVALNYPDWIEKLIVLDIAPKAYPPHHTHYFEAMRGMSLSMLKSRQEADTFLEAAIPEFAVRQFILKNLVRDENGDFKWRFNLESIYKNYGQINLALKSARVFNKPTLFIRGKNSGYIEDHDFAEINDLFPLVKIETIADAGHWIHADQPLVLKDRVLGFFGIVKS